MLAISILLYGMMLFAVIIAINTLKKAKRDGVILLGGKGSELRRKDHPMKFDQTYEALTFVTYIFLGILIVIPLLSLIGLIVVAIDNPVLTQIFEKLMHILEVIMNALSD